MKILVTGASGFIGKAVSERFESHGHNVLGLVRKATCGRTFIPDISADIDWSKYIQDVDCIIHCAALAHVTNKTLNESMNEYRRINVTATERLVSAAIRNKVKRFVFLSSVGVLGTNTNNRHPFNESDPSCPVDPYAISKLEAENIIIKKCFGTALEYVILRPPLVYGFGAKGNFQSLVSYVNSRLPLPTYTPSNRRSFVALENLLSLIVLCSNSATSPKAANQIFLIADDEVVSTSQFLQFINLSFRKTLRLPSVPYFIFNLSSKIFGVSRKLERMFDSLEINTEKVRSLTGWKPVISMREQFKLIADHDSSL